MPRETAPTTTRDAIWLCLYFDQLALDIFCRDDDESLDDNQKPPLVVTEKQRVYQCNLKAAHLGIKPEQSMDTAFTLSDQVTSVERQPDREIASLHHLAHWAYQFTPNVAIKSDNCLLLEVSSSLKLFHGLSALWQKISTGLKDQNYNVSIAQAKTPAAAMVLAKSGMRSIQQTPVQYLEASNNIITGLQQMGIGHLEQLFALPVSGVTRRFGTYFSDYLEKLKGNKPDPQKYIQPTAKFHHSITFLNDVNNLSSLSFPINRLLGELADFLTSRQLWVNQLTWHLSHRSHKSQHSFSVHLASPTNNIKMFLALTQLRLDQVTDVKEVDNIALGVSRFFPANQIPEDLFAGQGFQQHIDLKTNTEQQNQLLNMLNARLGNDACYGLSEENDHRPEKAWKKVKLNGKDYWRPDTAPERSARPSFLLPTPKALTVMEGRPYLAGKLTLINGPERIDFGWWDQPIDKPLTRDYYVARQKQGGLLWIFKYLAADRWYLHGIFS